MSRSRQQVRRVAIVVGTRPEIVKMAHIASELGHRTVVTYTGQHYDEALAGTFFDVFGMPRPSAVVEVGGRSRGEQIGVAVEALTRLWLNDRPDAVVVQGDTNTALAGALAANAVGLPLVHVEAGLRSFDRRMPEEHNRALIDRISDLLLAPTELGRDNLLAERIIERIVITGSTVVEAVKAALPSPGKRRRLLEDHRLVSSGYVLSTLHRPENVDDPKRLQTILEELGQLQLPVALPIHPRTRARVKAFGLEHLLTPLQVMEPLGYVDFLALSAESAMLVSDSGGVQGEASVYKRPVVIVRSSTEWPEVVGTFTTMSEPEALGRTVDSWLDDIGGHHERLRHIPSPYGEGEASRLSAAAILDLLD